MGSRRGGCGVCCGAVVPLARVASPTGYGGDVHISGRTAGGADSGGHDMTLISSSSSSSSSIQIHNVAGETAGRVAAAFLINVVEGLSSGLRAMLSRSLLSLFFSPSEMYGMHSERPNECRVPFFVCVEDRSGVVFEFLHVKHSGLFASARSDVLANDGVDASLNERPPQPTSHRSTAASEVVVVVIACTAAADAFDGDNKNSDGRGGAA
ncbi:hypothetical protein ECC02_003029 [Trypanosoma cruzi]|uniref:Uncharacterized protein n=1 Tax=Trypanosoma cruzi TaxID=5693 RepID=A0A7J6YB87_TRYCR|nr:hypothetical protein ECC02_003029 [Trypanosoma cruzi]